MARRKRRVVARGWQQPGEGVARWTVSPMTLGRRIALPCLVPMDDRSTSRTDWREMATMAGFSTSRGKGRLFTPFPAVSQLLPVLQMHFRFYADICTYFISLLDGHFKTFWTVPGTFPSTSGSRILLRVQHPRPKMECQQVCLCTSLIVYDTLCHKSRSKNSWI